MISLLAGNSRILVTIDAHGRWAQLYYPYAGQFQHLHDERLGLFDVDSEKFDWLGEDPASVRSQGYIENSNCPRTIHHVQGLDVTVDDVVHPNMDLVIRRIIVHNPDQAARRLRLFHYQSLTIMESLYQDSAYWDPDRKTVTHYKRRFYFQLWGRPDFDAFTCGEHTLKGLKGSYVDAEDGKLSGGPISHGAADSVVQWNIEVPPGESKTAHLLLMMADSRHAVNEFYAMLLMRDPTQLIAESVGYWNHWIARKPLPQAPGLPESVPRLYARSVYILENCSSDNGSIIASPDPRTLKSGGDNYNYCWWRDGGYISKAMDEVGLYQHTHRFLRFARECQEKEGYFLHRHFPDGAVGSTWHPPPFIQADQTATVIAAAWHHFKRQGDLDELLQFWPLVRDAADFLMDFTDDRGLPLPSFDLWEERKAVNSYTTAAVVHGLGRAVKIGEQLGKRTAFWQKAYDRMKAAALEHLWDDERGCFRKSIDPVDDRVDASTLLAIKLGLIAADDPRAERLVKTVEETLWSKKTGGLARYVGDTYYGTQNPWLICTLWLGEAHLMLGRPDRCREMIAWVAAAASPTGLFPEQIDSQTGEHTSVTPLVWSHSTFIDVVNKFTEAGAGLAPPVR